MKATPGYGFYHFNSRGNAQEKASTDMGKTKTYGGMNSSGASKGAMGNMKTVKKVAAVKVNSK